MTKQELINQKENKIKSCKKDIKAYKAEISYLESCYEIKRKDILRNYKEYLKLKVVECEDHNWYFPSKAPMIKYLYITVLDGFYLSNEVEIFVKVYAKEILNLNFHYYTTF